MGLFRDAAPRLTWWAARGSGLGAALARRLQSPADALDMAGAVVSALAAVAHAQPMHLARPPSGGRGQGSGGNTLNGLVAVLQYLDFFPLATQRAAVGAAAVGLGDSWQRRTENLHDFLCWGIRSRTWTLTR